MIHVLVILLRLAGGIMLALAALHVPISRRLKWNEEGALLSPVNAAVFHVHTLFICLILVLMGLPSIIDPAVFLEPTRAGGWLAWIFAAFWATRLYVQWFVFPRTLWIGKRLETQIHFVFTAIWLFLATLFSLCGTLQAGCIQ